MKTQSKKTIELKYIIAGIAMISFLFSLLMIGKYGWVIWWILTGLFGNNEIPHA